nr:MAG TPA: tail protein [Bacteriophage sp.]
MGLFRTHTVTTRADKISAFSVATAEYGAVVPEILGTTRVAGNVIYYDDFTAHEHKETHKSGKGGGVKSVSITYTYTVAAIIALCEGPVAGIGTVWKGSDLMGLAGAGLTLFKGTDSQTAWNYTTSKHPNKARPYPGLAYVAGVLDLGDSASFPSFNFEVKGKLLSTGDGVDVNPADYIQYILQKAGLGGITVDGLDNYRAYCNAADLLISTPMDDATQAKTAQSIINDIATITGAYIFWSNDHFKIIPMADEAIGSWKPNTTVMYELTPDDFIPMDDGSCIQYQRKDSADIYNSFPVEFTNRKNGYGQETVSYELTDDIAARGFNQASSISAGYIYTKERAVKVAKLIAHRNQIEKDQYTFQLDWAFCRLEPGDLVRIKDEKAGIVNDDGTGRLVAITSVTEDDTGLYTITAVPRREGTYTAPAYTVTNTDRPTLNTNTDPDNTTIIHFQPPVDATTAGYEIWIGAKGAGNNWGGCILYGCDDDTNYREIGRVAASARFGTLASDMTATATTMTVKCNDTFIGANEEQAKAGDTLCWVDGECVSYTTVTLNSDGTYTLGGLVRGQYNTTAAAHGSGSGFCRCDATLFKYTFPAADIGRKFYLKACSINMFGTVEQDLSAVDAIEITPAAYYVPACSGVTATTQYRGQSDLARYDLIVTWTPPNSPSYSTGMVYYKIKSADGTYPTEWTFGGTGTNSATIPNCPVGAMYKLCVTTKDKYGVESSKDNAPTYEILVATKYATPTTPVNVAIKFTSDARITWDPVTNADIAWYEIRTDKNPGVDTGMVGKTTGTSYVFTPTARPDGSITYYIYAKGATGVYGVPATITPTLAAPAKPSTAPKVTAKVGGLSITIGAIPAGALGAIIHITTSGSTSANTDINTTDTTVSFVCNNGVYAVTYDYYDMFGEGPVSDQTTVTVKLQISGDAIHVTKDTVFDKNVVVKGMIAAGAVTSNAIDISDGTTSGARVEITKNLIQVYDSNGVLRVRLGIWS